MLYKTVCKNILRKPRTKFISVQIIEMGNTFKRNSEAGWDNFIKSFSSSTDDSQGTTESDSKSVEMSSDTKVPVEISMTAPKIIQHSQYPVENHVVTTEDKYLLTLHRIPHGRNSKNVYRYWEAVRFYQKRRSLNG